MQTQIARQDDFEQARQRALLFAELRRALRIINRSDPLLLADLTDRREGVREIATERLWEEMAPVLEAWHLLRIGAPAESPKDQSSKTVRP